MLKTDNQLEIQIFPPSLQARGSFDGGRITEVKPIGFPGEGSAVRRVGPLFYWAWATAEGPAKIGMHPHRGFEIISYVLRGKMRHRDTLGTVSDVSAGGAQIMQTGSGVSHEEEMLEGPTDFFQIWFEPDLREALTKTPIYRGFDAGDFTATRQEGVRIKPVLGAGAPFSLSADAALWDIEVKAGDVFRRPLSQGRALAAVAVSGSGVWKGPETGMKAGDFAVVKANRDSNVELEAGQDEPLRIVAVEAPLEVAYPLYSVA